MTEPRKAVALISGDLDSMLAARLMRDQGIHIKHVVADAQERAAILGELSQRSGM